MISPDPDLTRFGAEVKKARAGKGWTLGILAHEAFGNQERKGFVSQIENGKRNLSALTISKLHGVLDLPQVLVDRMLGLPLPDEDDHSPLEDEAEALITRQGPLAERLKISESLVIALAYKYAEGNPADFDGALAGLEHALETAAEERAKGRLPSNVPDAVAEVMARVDALNDEGRIDEGKTALLDALREQRDVIAQAEAVQLRFLAKGLAQAVLTRDVGMAVSLELKKLALDGGVDFEALRAVRQVWYERGRDKGLRFDLEVAIALAKTCADRAIGADQRGNAANDLGNALATLGERESGTAQLLAAVAAYENALLEWTQDKVPLEWAATQNNLGTALAALGERVSGTAQLLAAVAACENALREFTRDKVPLNWAGAQFNLAVVEESLADKAEGEARGVHLRQALWYVEAALEVFDPQASAYSFEQTNRLRARLLAALGEA